MLHTFCDDSYLETSSVNSLKALARFPLFLPQPGMERAKCSPDAEEEWDTCLWARPHLSRCPSCSKEDRSIFPLSIQLTLPTSFDKRAGCCVLAWYREHEQPMPSTGHTQPVKSSEGSALLCHCPLLRGHIWHRHNVDTH